MRIHEIVLQYKLATRKFFWIQLGFGFSLLIAELAVKAYPKNNQFAEHVMKTIYLPGMIFVMVGATIGLAIMINLTVNAWIKPFLFDDILPLNREMALLIATEAVAILLLLLY